MFLLHRPTRSISARAWKGQDTRFQDLFSRVGYSPNYFRAVVADEQRTVIAHGNTYRTSPDMAVIYDKPGHKIFIAAQGLAVFHGNADHFISRAAAAVP